jgi:hypothetical protein
VLVELLALAGDVLQRPDASRAGHARLREAPGTSLDLTRVESVRSPDARSALAAAGLAACAVGLLGTNAGVLWLVAGVWTVRAMAGAPVGFAWGTACLGAAARWGTLGLGDVAVATRLGGPTITAGPALVRAGLIAALAAAVLDEARGHARTSETWSERAAAAAALVGLAAMFLVRGPGDPRTLLPVFWGAAAVSLSVVVLLLRPLVIRVPAWVAPALTVGGTVVAVAAV